MKTVTITCDRCGKDLTGNGPGFRLRLTAESIPDTTGLNYLVMMYPPIRDDMHFCNLYCLHRWLDEHRHTIALWLEEKDE